MRRSIVAIMLFLAVCSLVSVSFVGPVDRAEASEKKGEALFKEHCTLCHPDGGNIVNPKKTLQKKDLEANKILSKDDIVKFMRKPGPGMTSFDARTISDKDAREIAEYILKTFKK